MFLLANFFNFKSATPVIALLFGLEEESRFTRVNLLKGVNELIGVLGSDSLTFADITSLLIIY